MHHQSPAVTHWTSFLISTAETLIQQCKTFFFLFFKFFFIFFIFFIFCHLPVATSDAMTGRIHRDIMTLTTERGITWNSCLVKWGQIPIPYFHMIIKHHHTILQVKKCHLWLWYLWFYTLRYWKEWVNLKNRLWNPHITLAVCDIARVCMHPQQLPTVVTPLFSEWKTSAISNSLFWHYTAIWHITFASWKSMLLKKITSEQGFSSWCQAVTG